MKRTIHTHEVADVALIKSNLLQWAQQYEDIVWLDSNEYQQQKYQQYDAILAVDAFTSLKTDYKHAFDELEEYQTTTNDWIFGYLSYDLKNDTERLTSQNYDELAFADLYFFQPKKLFLLKDNCLEMHYLAMVDDEMEFDYKALIAVNSEKSIPSPLEVSINSKISKSAYIEKVSGLLKHIHLGDIYEANFCQEFYARGTICPLDTYKRLNALSVPPFASYARFDEHYVLSASPERYLKKYGNKIVSQPIKGTAKRSPIKDKDATFAKTLSQNSKERSENIMIVDLVRNDLSRTAKKGSVQVEELCTIYPFKQVHHMISTITSEIGVGISPVDVLRSTFPMGSMTGAPKLRAMQIIEALETSKRGLYSGAIGYFTPAGDFDFNVVIRTILYNAAQQYVSYSVGGAITAGSDPEAEYEECLLKAKALREVLEGDL